MNCLSTKVLTLLQESINAIHICEPKIPLRVGDLYLKKMCENEEGICSPVVVVTLINFTIPHSQFMAHHDDLFHSISTPTQLLLTKKYQNQSLGFTKWFRAREKFLHQIQTFHQQQQELDRIGLSYLDLPWLSLPLEFIHDFQVCSQLVHLQPNLLIGLPDCMWTSRKLLIEKAHRRADILVKGPLPSYVL